MPPPLESGLAMMGTTWQEECWLCKFCSPAFQSLTASTLAREMLPGD